MLFDCWFYYFTLLYSLLFLAFLPFFGCTRVFDCPPEGNSEVSISSLIHREPLATSYAYCGALFLFSVVYCQSDSQKDNTVSLVRFVASFLSAKCLAIPLILPLGSISNSSVHDTFFIVGAVGEVVVCAIVEWEKTARAAAKFKWAGRVHVASAATMLASVIAAACVGSHHPKHAGVYTLLAMEYLFGIALATSAFVTHYYKF